MLTHLKALQASVSDRKATFGEIIRDALGITALQKRLEVSESANALLANKLDNRLNDLQKLSRADIEMGYRGNCTVVLTGVYNGRGYVQFYDVPPDEFRHIVEEYRSRQRHSLLRNIDSPMGMSGSYMV